MHHSGTSQRRCSEWLVRGLFALLATMGVALSVAALPAVALAASSPTEVQTEPAEVIPGGAKLKGELNPNGAPTTYYFKYAQDTCDEGCTPKTTSVAGPLTGDTQQEVSAVEVTGLAPGRYWYYLVANNVEGISYGSPVNFTVEATGEPSEVVTEPAEASPTGYKLNGKLNPDGLPTTYYYEYIGSNEVECLDMEPGLERCWHQTARVGPITGDTQQEVPPVEVTGLTVGVTYHYRLVASNADRTVWGNEASFTVGFPPTITDESVSNLTERDATLQAQIDTEGLETSYQFRLSAICGGKGACLVVVNYPLPSGLLLGSFVDQSVSLDLNTAGVTLQPGGTYTYSVTATNASGTTEGAPHNFTTPENVVQPLSTTTSPLSGAGQPAGSDTNSGGQPAGSGVASSSSTPGVQSPGPGLGKTIKLETLTNAQKLAKALKVCDKKPKKQWASCKKQAEKKYATTSKNSHQHRA
jgi:hypothetical protein